MSISFNSALTGAVLGGALTYASIAQPRTILDQFSMKDMHMLRAFLTATAGSAVITAILSRFSSFKPCIRPAMTINLFSRYDANMLGGGLIGTGMALTGACPGSVIPQLANGIPSAWPAFLGALSGGLVWISVGEQLHKSQAKPFSPSRNTFQGRLGISYPIVVGMYVTTCLTVVAASTLFDRVPSNTRSGIKGGLAITLAQAVSIITTQNMLCSSGMFEAPARWLVWVVQRALGRIDASAAHPKPPSCSNTGIWFAIGEYVGAALLAHALGIQTPSESLTSDAQIGKLFIGGVALGFGARLAGGCTSGHGISGMSAMSVASMVTVATMFASGMAVTTIL